MIKRNMSDTTEEKQVNPNLFKKGQSGNPKGRPKGSGGGLKDFDRKKFLSMTDDEKNEFLDKLSPEIRYRMAEGNPHQTSDNTVEVTLPQPLLHHVHNNESPTQSIEAKEED